MVRDHINVTCVTTWPASLPTLNCCTVAVFVIVATCLVLVEFYKTQYVTDTRYLILSIICFCLASPFSYAYTYTIFYLLVR